MIKRRRGKSMQFDVNKPCPLCKKIPSLKRDTQPPTSATHTNRGGGGVRYFTQCGCIAGPIMTGPYFAARAWEHAMSQRQQRVQHD